MKKIKYDKYDEQGYYKASTESERKYTVREAMQHLHDNGFKPMFNNSRKLKYVWTNDNGTNAVIL